LRGILAQVNGGIGKQFCILPALKKYNESKKEVSVLSGYPLVYQKLQKDKKISSIFTYDAGNKPSPFMYNYMMDNELKYERPEPYLEEEFIQKENLHIAQLYYKTFGLDMPKEVPVYNWQPTDEEINNAKQYYDNMKKEYDKVIMFQPFGGQVIPEGDERALFPQTAVDMYNYFKKKGYHVIVITNNPNMQKYIQGTYEGNLNIIAHLLRENVPFFGVDSSIQHLTNTSYVKEKRTDNKKNTFVVWSKTRFENFGYQFNLNIFLQNLPEKCRCQRTFGIPFDGWQCPYNQECRQFNSNDLISAIDANL
jgi:hypothetical protein